MTGVEVSTMAAHTSTLDSVPASPAPHRHSVWTGEMPILYRALTMVVVFGLITVIGCVQG